MWWTSHFTQSLRDPPSQLLQTDKSLTVTSICLVSQLNRVINMINFPEIIVKSLLCWKTWWINQNAEIRTEAVIMDFHIARDGLQIYIKYSKTDFICVKFQANADRSLDDRRTGYIVNKFEQGGGAVRWGPSSNISGRDSTRWGQGCQGWDRALYGILPEQTDWQTWLKTLTDYINLIVN